MKTEEELAEARALGEILPYRWTPEQRERVIALTGWSAADVDEVITVSWTLNNSLKEKR